MGTSSDVVEQGVFVSSVWDDDTASWIYAGRNKTQRATSVYVDHLQKLGHTKIRVIRPDGSRQYIG